MAISRFRQRTAREWTAGIIRYWRAGVEKSSPINYSHEFIQSKRQMTDQIGQSTTVSRPCTSTDTVVRKTTSQLTLWVGPTKKVVSTNRGLLDEITLTGDVFRWNDYVTGKSSITIPSDAMDRAAADVYSCLRPRMSLINTLVDLATFRSLYEGIYTRVAYAVRAPGRQLTRLDRHNFVVRARRRGLTGARAFLRNLGSDYLAWSFGIGPLVRDVETMAEVLANAMYGIPEPQTQTYHGYAAGGSVQATGVVTKGNYGNDLGGTWEWVTTGRYRVSNTLKVEWSTQAMSLFRDRTWVAFNQLGLYALFGAMWDAIPFSFIADWMLPTRSLVNLLDETHATRPTFTILDSCQSIKKWWETSYKLTKIIGTTWMPFDYVAGGQMPHSTVSEITYSRTVPSPLSLPYWEAVPGLNGRRTSYLGALMLQRFL